MNFTFITLGCPKNEVDTAYYIKKLQDLGHHFVYDAEKADYIFLNTCAFIKDAISESLETYEELTKKYTKERVIITGCLVERLKHRLEGVKFIRGDDIEKINEVIEGTYVPDFSKKQQFIYNGERFCIDNLPYAYIKIQEGCSRKCAFCTIPLIRGKPRTRSILSIKNEALELASKGKKEIILVGEDLTLYKDLIPLLKELTKIKDVKLIRLMYLHPNGVKKELLRYISDNPKMAKYLHIPIQHISDKVLKKMGRRGGERAVRKAIEYARELLPDAFIRTEIMVGFPGEDERDFEKLLYFLEEMHIERIGVFKYSNEEGAKSFRFTQVQDEIKEERFQRAYLLASLLMEEAKKKLNNKKIRVISDTSTIGRTEFDAPSSDFTVRFSKKTKPGNIYKKKIVYNEHTDELIAL